MVACSLQYHPWLLAQNRHMQFCVQIMEDLIHAKFQPIHAYPHVH